MNMYDDDDYDEEDDIGEDLDDLRRACMVSEANSDEVIADRGFDGGIPSDSESEDDYKMLRSIKSQLASSVDVNFRGGPPIVLCLPSDSESEDDFEILRKIKSELEAPVDVCVPPMGLSDEDEVDAFETLHSIRSQFSGEFNANLFTCQSSLPASSSSFPESAQAFVDAIRKNRSYQNFLRNKLTEIESTIEQNQKHKKNVKIVKDFQASCKRKTSQALSQGKDSRIELISTYTKDNVKKTSPLTLNPPENPCVANYRMALEKYPVSIDRRTWSTEENQNLAKGIKQQVQDTLLYEAIDRSKNYSLEGGSTEDIDAILESVKNLEITPEMIRQFLPKINWTQLASMYIKDRSAAECEARWMSSEDPLINNSPWTAEEDMNLLLIIQKKGLTDWLDIAVSLGTNRTPFQCLVRYQRSLNPDILRREWTVEEDDQLRAAVDLFGEKDWQSVANLLEGRTGTQCSNRWKKAIHPTKKRVGRWSLEEDKRMKVAVTLFGPQKWHKIAEFVPGRTPPQCRERWVNSLDPKVNRGKWTDEEDAKLKEAITQHGYSSWSKVASHMHNRTDNQCWRRWKSLYPQLVPLKQEATRLKRQVIASNFVDRESERPALIASDFLSLPKISLDVAMKKKRKVKEKKTDVEDEITAKRQIKRRRKEKQRRRRSKTVKSRRKVSAVVPMEN